jgi:hypothetical protein
MLQPDQGKIPKAARDLDGKLIFVRGYMYPGPYQFGLKQFIISRDNGKCKFCIPNPRSTDVIGVILVGDLRIDYTSRLVGLGGRFHVVPKDDQVHLFGDPAYQLEADYVK